MKRLLGLLLFLGCTTATTSNPVHVVIVGTTDVHGWFNGRTESGVHYGGVALFASYVSALRDANRGHVIVVDSGDLFQGTLESNLFEGEPVVRAYNAIGYVAAAVGNHEFDYGPVGPASVPQRSGDDPFGALERNAKVANFLFLSANMVEKSTGRAPAWARPSTIVDVAGTRIGIIGLSTPDTPNVTMRANVATLDFTDPVAATIRAARELRARGADSVIVIAHMGGRCTDMRDPNDVASCEREQEAMHYLQSLPRGTIDAYFGGHTHSQMRQFVGGVPALEALAYSQEFATLDAWIDPRAHRTVRSEIRPHTMICEQAYSETETCDPRQGPANARLIPRVFEGKTIVPDARISALFEPYLRRVAAKRSEPLGIRTAGRFTRSYEKESSLGDLLADALRKVKNSDVAFMNSGGIRSDLRAGDLVYGDIFEVSPFDNYPAVVTLTGGQILEALRITTAGDRPLLQVSGLRYSFDLAKDADRSLAERNRIVSVTLENGQPLDPSALYRVAMPDFLAQGGDGLLPVMQQVPKERVEISIDQPLREVLIPALEAFPQPLEPKLDGRIKMLNAGA